MKPFPSGFYTYENIELEPLVIKRMGTGLYTSCTDARKHPSKSSKLPGLALKWIEGCLFGLPEKSWRQPKVDRYYHEIRKAYTGANLSETKTGKLLLQFIWVSKANPLHFELCANT